MSLRYNNPDGENICLTILYLYDIVLLEQIISSQEVEATLFFPCNLVNCLIEKDSGRYDEKELRKDIKHCFDVFFQLIIFFNIIKDATSQQRLY